MFINRDKKSQPFIKELTSKQKIKICDLYSRGEDKMSIKHLMIKDFKKGYAFGHLIQPAINKMNQIQDICTSLMSGTMIDKPADKENEATYIPVPKTEKELIKIAKSYYKDCDEKAFDELVKLIVSATGTWKEYQSTFKQD